MVIYFRHWLLEAKNLATKICSESRQNGIDFADWPCRIAVVAAKEALVLHLDYLNWARWDLVELELRLEPPFVS